MSRELLLNLQQILLEQREQKAGNIEQFQEMKKIMKQIPSDQINPNFKGTIDEISAYINHDIRTKNEINEHVKHHTLNISRWQEELSMLRAGGGAVTIDYEQRMGREI
ncbi:hypothetical protein J2S74_002360 [Evansella vedderi]|uniref:Uncharacterized protein n=1 Tax=Evansella vedderi TaxID=38282 RepID=A0ABT9ZWW3_9BACI|nr:hypothetical protein [Evansella vedderi]MDQ0254978.1 hypothetical protein [Evansella vedderi]